MLYPSANLLRRSGNHPDREHWKAFDHLTIHDLIRSGIFMFSFCSFALPWLGRLAEESTAESDTDGLNLGVVGKSILSELTADTGLLEAAEGDLVAKHVVVVDPDGTGLEGVRDTEGGVKVGGVDGSSKTIGGLVASLDDIILGLELADRADRSEDFFLHDLHVLADIGEDGGLDEVTFLTVALATGLDLGTSLLARLDIVHDSVELKLADLRALEGVGLKWVANNVLGCSLLERGNEFVVNARLDVDTGARAAALAVVEENTEVDPRDGVFDVCIVEDDIRRLATELEGDLLQVGLGGSLEDGSANDS